VLRFSIQWNENGHNGNDFDAHCREPNGTHIYYTNKGRLHPSSGVLDVDIIRPELGGVAVENIVWSRPGDMPEGVYHFYVKNYTDRGGRGGFRAEVEYNGDIYEYDYPHALSEKEEVTVARVKFSRRHGIEFLESLPSSLTTTEVWGVKTNQWQKVSLMCLSPNYWGECGVGNKHYLMMLAGCVSDEEPNGFFNEYLPQELLKHKRVFAALGNKMKCDTVDDQLSGVGFSSTQKNSVVMRVSGSRVVRVTF
jgi:hypothetical protein